MMMAQLKFGVEGACDGREISKRLHQSYEYLIDETIAVPAVESQML